MKRRVKFSPLLAVILVATLLVGVSGAPVSATSHITPIYDIQGEGHLSPYVGTEVTTHGVITGIGFRSYWVQDPLGDGNDATSDGMFVFDFRSASSLGIAVGTCVELTDSISERIGGGAATGNLSDTQMSVPVLTVIDCASTFSGYSFPEPVAIGASGRIPPNEIVISSDELPVNLQDVPGDFNPETDAIDFYESMEGMLVTVEAPQAVSATRQFGTFSAEFFTLPNGGEHVEPQDAVNDRGGIMLQPDPDNLGDQNPERVQIQLLGSPLYQGSMFPPVSVNVGDTLEDVTGIMGYSFGNFEVNAITEIVVIDGGLTPETSEIEGDKNRVTVASYNVLNLSPGSSDDDQRVALADQVVNALNSPDVIALQEIQDNSGTTNDGTTSADETLEALADEIAAAGGPSYEYIDVPPVDGTEGGVPGGNIRVAYLYNPARVSLVAIESLTPAVLNAAGASNSAAFAGTRTPLAATFSFKTNEFTVVNVHLSSRFGSTPIFGGPQPFVQAAESGGSGREDQTGALNDYVDSLLSIDGDARIMVVGDFNTFEWTNDLTEILPGPGDDRVLTNLVPTAKDKGEDDDDDDDEEVSELPEDAEYSFIFDGNSQMLDQFLVTDSLKKGTKFDVVHLNVDFSRRFADVTASDHEPMLASFKMKLPKDLVEIQILAISDWHAQLDPLFVFGQGSFGGAAALSTYFDRERDNIKNTLTLTAGDAYGASTPLSGFFNEEPAIRAMRLMGFDVDTFGNHNFDKGIDALQSLVDIASAGGSEPGSSFQYVSANLENRDDNLEGVEDFKVFKFQGVKVAVIGVTNPEAPTLVFPGSFGTIVVTDPIAAANSARAAAEAEGADLFVLIAHMGLTGPGSGPLIDLANGVTGFDLILGDHTDVQFSGEINGAMVIENRSRGRSYSRVQITYNKKSDAVVSSSAAFVSPISANVTPDAAIVDFLAPLRAELDTLLGVVVGTSSVGPILRSDECEHSSGRTCESVIGNVITDAMRTTYGTDFAITNSGGIRADLTCPLTDVPGDFCNAGDEGSITAGQVLTVLPFGNSVVTLDMTGADLKAHLERGVSGSPGASGRFAQVSGLCFSFNIEAAVGSRITSAVFQAGDGTCTGGAVDLTAGSTYSVAENDFTASGGDGYPSDISSAVTRGFLDQVTRDYISANTPILPTIQGRITCVDANPGSGNDCPVALP